MVTVWISIWEKKMAQLLNRYFELWYCSIHDMVCHATCSKISKSIYMVTQLSYGCINLLNNNIGGEAKTKEYIEEIKRLGLNVLKPDINKSGKTYIKEENGIRFIIYGFCIDSFSRLIYLCNI